MSPDIKTFNEHTSGPGFMIGSDKGMWGIKDNDISRPEWPFVIIWISAVFKEGSQNQYYFRFALDGYPANAPIASPWNIEKQTFLESCKWPKGGPVTRSIFNSNWKPNQNYGATLYAPCDRLAMMGHPAWANQFPDLWWKPEYRIEKYLYFIHRNLNSSDYGHK